MKYIAKSNMKEYLLFYSMVSFNHWSPAPLILFEIRDWMRGMRAL